MINPDAANVTNSEDDWELETGDTLLNLTIYDLTNVPYCRATLSEHYLECIGIYNVGMLKISRGWDSGAAGIFFLQILTGVTLGDIISDPN